MIKTVKVKFTRGRYPLNQDNGKVVMKIKRYNKRKLVNGQMKAKPESYKKNQIALWL